MSIARAPSTIVRFTLSAMPLSSGVNGGEIDLFPSVFTFSQGILQSHIPLGAIGMKFLYGGSSKLLVLSLDSLVDVMDVTSVLHESHHQVSRMTIYERGRMTKSIWKRWFNFPYDVRVDYLADLFCNLKITMERKFVCLSYRSITNESNDEQVEQDVKMKKKGRLRYFEAEVGV